MAEVHVHHDTPPSRFAVVAASSLAVGASIGAAVTTRVTRRSRTNRARYTADPVRGDATSAEAQRNERARKEPPSRLVLRVDAFQRRHAVIAFPLAVGKKFAEDAAGSLAALVAYYGVLSVFPLLLALTTVLGALLAHNPGLQDHILHSTLAQFPVIGDQLRTNVHSLHTSGFALVIGIAGALWGGMGVMKAAGKAMDDLWEVPKRQRPRFLRAIVRAALLLVVLGGGIVVTSLLSGLGTSADGNVALRVGGIAAATALNIGVFLLGFRVLTVRDIAWRDLVWGAVVAGIGWLVLQSFGGWYIGHRLANASQTYGTFAVLLGLLTWLYLQAQLTLFAAEINIVRAGRLWPRGLAGELTDADKRAYSAYAEVEERRPDEDVGVGFTG
jgi:YihY family inner membrane protein